MIFLTDRPILMNFRYAIIIMLLFAACKQEDKPTCFNRKCGKVGMHLMIRYYTPDEQDTMYLNVYQANGAFDNILYSRTLSGEDLYLMDENPSTWSVDSLMVQGYDYELIIPAAMDTLRVWNVYNSSDTSYVECGRVRTECYDFAAQAQASGGSNNYVVRHDYPVYGVLFVK